MSNNGHRERIVFSVGGSLIVPNGGIDTDFLSKFNKFIRKQLSRKPSGQFFLIVGGGEIARQYQQVGREVLGHDVAPDDLDWLAIHVTRLNAQLIRTIFKDIAHPYVIKNYEIIRKAEESVVVASGWKPGRSTDYDAVLLCEDYGAKTVINLSNIDKVYDKDPNKYTDAKAINKISWASFRKIVGNEWSPGLNTPFDPVAAKKAQELGIKVVVLNGKNFENIEKYMNGEKFLGTVIE